MTISEFLVCLEGKTGHAPKSTSDGWQSCCPAHPDSTPSLTVTEEDHKILIHCHAGCTFAAVVSSLGLKPSDLMPPKDRVKRKDVATYDYTDSSGVVVHQTVRYEPKGFSQRRPDPDKPGQFIWSLKGVKTVLYRLPSLELAKFTGDTIYIVEGEKDADALTARGFCATCNPMGAGKWEPQYTDALIGADCIIIPDKDDTGRKHLDLVGRQLSGKAGRLRVIHLPDSPDSNKWPVKDAADYFAAGYTADDLRALAAAAPDWAPAAPPADTAADREPDTDHEPAKPPPPVHEFGALAGILNGNADSLSLLKETFFTDPRARAVLTALRQLAFDARPLDIVSLLDYLTAHELLTPAGGEEFIRSLPSFYESFFGHLDVIKDRSVRRKLANFSTMLADVVHDIAVDPRQILSQLKDATEIIVTSSSGDDLDALLEKREFNPSVVPPDIRPIFTLAGHVICTPANLTAITAAVKAGKTAAIGAMIASSMPHSPDADMLGFSSVNPECKTVLHFDSEQSPDDHWHVIKRALRRAEQPVPPAWFHSFCLTGFGCTRAWAAIQRSIQANASKHAGIHSIFLDGIADLVNDVNDPSECNAFVAQLHDLAIHYDCPIIGVIHFNPGSDSKTRGHLGSQFERKSETNLKLEKNQEEITSVWSDKQRREPILRNTAPAFKFDRTVNMHVSCNSTADDAQKEKNASLQRVAADIFTGRPAMRHSDMVSTVQDLDKIQRRGAEKKVEKLIAAGVVKHSIGSLYVLAT